MDEALFSLKTALDILDPDDNWDMGDLKKLCRAAGLKCQSGKAVSRLVNEAKPDSYWRFDA